MTFFLFIVGNIPYEATDEQLKDIFNQAGPVLSFRLKYSFLLIFIFVYASSKVYYHSHKKKHK